MVNVVFLIILEYSSKSSNKYESIVDCLGISPIIKCVDIA